MDRVFPNFEAGRIQGDPGEMTLQQPPLYPQNYNHLQCGLPATRPEPL